MGTQKSGNKKQKHTSEKKQHWWLAATHVVFTNSGQTEMGNAPINATICNAQKAIPVSKVQEIQMQAQAHFHQRSSFAGQGLEVVDVFILSINYLGHMTLSEFNKLPENAAAKQERKPEQKVGEVTPLPRKSSVPEGLQ